MKRINFARKAVTPETRRKISEALKGAVRGVKGRMAKGAAKSAKGMKGKATAKSAAVGAKKATDMAQGMTGYRPTAKGSASKTRGAAADQSARGGFTGYTTKSASKQNKYKQNLRDVLK